METSNLTCYDEIGVEKSDRLLGGKHRGRYTTEKLIDQIFEQMVDDYGESHRDFGWVIAMNGKALPYYTPRYKKTEELCITVFGSRFEMAQARIQGHRDKGGVVLFIDLFCSRLDKRQDLRIQ